MKLLAPNNKKSNLSEQQYHLVRSENFINWFGDWLSLAKAKTLENNITGFYKSAFKGNEEQFLFEMAVQSNNSNSERQGALSVAGEELIELALKLYPNAKVGDKFVPVVSKVVDENGEPNSDSILIYLYSIKKENTIIISKIFNVSRITIYRSLKRLGITNDYYQAQGVSKDLINKGLELYNQGKSLREIAKIIGVHKSSINRWAISNNIIRTLRESKGISLEDIESAIKSYQSGISLKLSGKLVGVSDTAVLRWLIEKNIPIRSRSEAQSIRAEEGRQPIRGIRLYIKNRDSEIRADSVYEASRIVQLLSDKDVEYVERYKGQILLPNGKRYTPDLFVMLKNGKKIVEEIKPDFQKENEYVLLKANSAQKKLSQQNIDYRIVTEIIMGRGAFELLKNTDVRLEKETDYKSYKRAIDTAISQIKLYDGSNKTFDGSKPDIRFYDGGGLSKTPAPKKDRVYGSKLNKPKSSESKYKASSIILSPSLIKSINTIIKEHNENNPNKKIPLSTAKAVVRRGMGAYSSTHRPTIKDGKPNNRVAWGLARLNAFVYKIENGHSKSGKYNQDDDLINELGYKVEKMNNGGQTIYKKPEPKYEYGEVLDLKGYGKVKILGSAWITPPITARPQYIYDFLLNPDAKITKFKKNDFSLYEYEVDMMLADVDTGIDYEKSYEKYLGSGLRATGNPPLDYIKFIEVINRSLYYKNHPEFELNPTVKNFYEAYAIDGNMKFGGTVYNGVPVGYSIDPNLVISAFSNPIDEEKVVKYTEVMKEQMLSHDFPTIKGFPIIIGEEDFGKYFMNGEEVTEEFTGQRAWMVTDGHHRVLSALEAHLPHLEVELDYSTVTNMDEYYKDGGQTKNAKMKKSTKRLTPKEVKGKVELISSKIDEIKKRLKWHEGKDVAYPLTETEIKILNDGLPELRKERERICKIYEGLKDKKQGTISDDMIQIKTFDIKFNYVYRILDAKYIVNYLRLNKKNKVDDKFYSTYEIESTEKDIEKFTAMLAEKMENYSDYIDLMKIRTDEREKKFNTPQVLLQWDENNLLIVELSEYLNGVVTKYDEAKVIYSTAPFEIPKIRTDIEVELDPMTKQAVRDVIYLDKYSKLTDEEGAFLYSKFKDYETLIDEYGEYVANVKEPVGEKKIEEFKEFMEMLDHKQYTYYSSYDETIEAYQITIDFINSVRGRIETLKAKQSGMDLFPETEINILRKSDVEEGIQSLETLLEIEPDNQEYKDAVESLKVLLETSFDDGGELINRNILEQSVGEKVRYEPDKDYLDEIDIKAINDILLLPKYRNITEEEAKFIYKAFYNYESKRNKQDKYIYQIKWKYSYGSNDKNARKEDEALKKFIERMDKDGLITFNNYDGNIEADKNVADFVNSVRNRVKKIISKKSIGDTSVVNRVSAVNETEILQAIESLEVLSELEPENQEYKDGIESLKILLETLSFEEGGEIKYYEVQKSGRSVLKAKFKKSDEENLESTSKMLDSLSDRGYALKEITEKEYRTFNYGNVNPEDMVEFTQGAEYFADGGKIKFDKNKVPSTRIYNYAIKLKRDNPEIWRLGGNIFGNQAFKNLEKVIKRGYWLDSEKWMFIKWRGYVARHQADFRIEGVIAMLKWIDTVNKGWEYMKEIIENEINPKVVMKEGGETIKSDTVTVEARTENGLEFDFDVNEDLNIDNVMNLAKQKCSPQNLKWLKFKGTKYTVETV